VCELLSLDGVAESPKLFFTEWDDAADAAGAGQELLDVCRRSTSPRSEA